MLVQFSIPLIFIKTVKTAGTSSEAFLQQALWGGEPGHSQGWMIAKDGFCTPRGKNTKPLSGLQERAIIRNGRLPRHSFGTIRRLKNHSTPDEIIAAVGQDFWNRSQKIVNIRNPFDAVVSKYYFSLRNAAQEEVPTFDEWVSTLSVPAKQHWMTANDPSVKVIRFEQLEGDLRQLVNDLGLVGPAHIPMFKTETRPAQSRDYRLLYTPTSREHVEQLYGDYLTAFDYSFS